MVDGPYVIGGHARQRNRAQRDQLKCSDARQRKVHGVVCSAGSAARGTCHIAPYQRAELQWGNRVNWQRHAADDGHRPTGGNAAQIAPTKPDQLRRCD